MDAGAARTAREKTQDLAAEAAKRIRDGDDIELTLLALGIGAFDRGHTHAHEKDTEPNPISGPRRRLSSYVKAVTESGVLPIATFNEPPNLTRPHPKFRKR